MAVTAGIYILTEKKAKILTALKASLRDAESVSINKDEEINGDIVKDGIFKEEYKEYTDNFGNNFSNETAVVVYDDYVSVLFEDCDPGEAEENAVRYSDIFGKTVLYFINIDNDAIVFGAADGGRIKTRLAYGEYLDEYGIKPEKINMDYLAFIYNAGNLTDLNRCAEASDGISDIVYALEEDYGIYAEVSPLTISLFKDKYKLLEKSRSFSVYSAL